MNRINFDQTTIYYEKIGEGIPILFIHPPGMGRRVFDLQRPLAEKYQLIFPDLSGHGDSDSILEGSIIRKYVNEINMILEEEQLDQVIICGYSAGGMIGQEFALTYPLKTKGLILSGGYPKVHSLGLHLMYTTGMKVLHSSPDTLAKLLAFSHAKSEDYRKQLYQHMKKSNYSHWYQYYNETYYYTCVDKLSSVSIPSITIYGEKAFWINKHKKFYENDPNFEIAYIKNGTHQIPTKKSKEFNQIVNNFVASKLKY